MTGPSRVPSSPTSDTFDPPLPGWVTSFRPWQIQAVDEILAEFERGTRFVLLNAPTGAGKTLIAELVRRLSGAKKTTYVATTKSLQDQFLEDFDYAKVLKGRSNYPTLDRPDLFNPGSRLSLSAADCTKRRGPMGMECGLCERVPDCPYERAVADALAAPLSVMNTAYFIAEANYVGRFPKRDLVIADECDTLESVLMGEVTVSLSPRQQKYYGIDPPERKTVKSTWKGWAQHAWLRVKSKTDALEIASKANPADAELKKEWTASSRLLGQLAFLLKELAKEEIGWVYDGYKEGSIVFKPIRVSEFGPDKLWRHGEQFLLMSATIVDPVEYTESLGIPAGEWEIVNLPAVFPAENRPVHVVPVANMTFKEQAEAWPKMAVAVGKVLAKHPNERILVHTVSYKLAEFLYTELRRQGHGKRVLVYSSSMTRQATLEDYKERKGSVLLAASMDRGIDLPGELCDVQVICKVPFISLGDKQVEARLYSKGGDLWYRVQSVRSLIQMTGRGVRTPTDKCVTYILDAQFMKNVWTKSKGLLPKWWKDALCWEGRCL